MSLDGVWKLLPGIQKTIKFLKLAGWHQWLSNIWLTAVCGCQAYPFVCMQDLFS